MTVATIGIDAVLSINTGTYGTPVWSEIDDARDVTLNLEAGEADASRRGSEWREFLQGLKDASIDLELVYDGADANFILLRDAFLNGTSIDVYVADAATGGAAEGLRMTAIVTGFTRNEPMEDILTTSVTIKPTPNANSGPAWVNL